VQSAEYEIGPCPALRIFSKTFFSLNTCTEHRSRSWLIKCSARVICDFRALIHQRQSKTAAAAVIYGVTAISTAPHGHILLTWLWFHHYVESIQSISLPNTVPLVKSRFLQAYPSLNHTLQYFRSLIISANPLYHLSDVKDFKSSFREYVYLFLVKPKILLGIPPASCCYWSLTFRNTVSVPSSAGDEEWMGTGRKWPVFIRKKKQWWGTLTNQKEGHSGGSGRKVWVRGIKRFTCRW